MGPRRRSIIWNYFLRNGDALAFCNLCKKDLSYKTSTTNLKRHLERKHALEFDMENGTVTDKQQHSAVQSIVSKQEEAYMEMDTASNIFIAPLNVKKVKVPTVTTNHTTNSEEIDNALLEFIVHDFQPCSIVEEHGFQQFAHCLNPSYSLPNEESIRTALLPALYEKTCSEAEKLVGEAVSVTATIDYWSSTTAENFIAVTVHFITEKFEVKSVLLECTSFAEDTTFIEVAALLRQIVTTWGLENKIMLAISNNDLIERAVKDELQWEYLPCYADTLNAIAEHGLKIILSLTNKVSNFIMCFKRNPNASAWLADFQKQSGQEPKKLVQNNNYCWNATFHMIERLLELEDTVNTVISLLDTNSIPAITSEEWDELRDVKKVLEPLDSVTKIMCKQNYVNMSSIIILTKGLERVYTEKQKCKMRPVAQTITLEFLRKIQAYAAKLEENTALLTSTLLDPRFKSVGFTDESIAETAKTTIESLVCDKIKEIAAGSSMEAETRDDSSSEFSVWSYFDKKMAAVQPMDTTMSRAVTEVERYLDASLLLRHEDPLAWWQQYVYKYPNLAQVVIEKIGTTATAVPCSQIYSKVGQKLCERRAQLSSDEVREFMFINVNNKL